MSDAKRKALTEREAELADALRAMVDHFYPPGEAWLAEDGTVLAIARAALAKLERREP